MSWKRTFDGPEPQRVNKWLAHAGVCSRREAETLIEAGAVYIDGEQVTDVGRKIAPGQTLVLNDRAELGLGAQISVVIHKPVGIVSACMRTVPSSRSSQEMNPPAPPLEPSPSA